MCGQPCQSLGVAYVANWPFKNNVQWPFERTFAPLVVFVIHVNIHVVGLTLSPSIFEEKFNVGIARTCGCGPFKMNGNILAKVPRLFIFG